MYGMLLNSADPGVGRHRVGPDTDRPVRHVSSRPSRRSGPRPARTSRSARSPEPPAFMRSWRASHASGVRLRGILGRAAPRRRIGLRSDRMHAKRPEDPAPDRQRPPQPARALPAQVKLAGPCYPVRRPDRRPAPVTRLSHLAPPAGPAARCPRLDCPPRHTCLPDPATGPARPSRTGAYPAAAISQSPCTRYRATAPPARYSTGPEAQPGTEDSNHLRAPQPTRPNAAIPHPDSHQHGRSGHCPPWVGAYIHAGLTTNQAPV